MTAIATVAGIRRVDTVTSCDEWYIARRRIAAGTANASGRHGSCC